MKCRHRFTRMWHHADYCAADAAPHLHVTCSRCAFTYLQFALFDREAA